MTGQDLFSALSILIMIICIVLHIKRKIKLFDDNYWYNIMSTILFVLSLIGTIVIFVAFFVNNWNNKVL